MQQMYEEESKNTRRHTIHSVVHKSEPLFVKSNMHQQERKNKGRHSMVHQSEPYLVGNRHQQKRNSKGRHIIDSMVHQPEPSYFKHNKNVEKKTTVQVKQNKVFGIFRRRTSETKAKDDIMQQMYEEESKNTRRHTIHSVVHKSEPLFVKSNMHQQERKNKGRHSMVHQSEPYLVGNMHQQKRNNKGKHIIDSMVHQPESSHIKHDKNVEKKTTVQVKQNKVFDIIRRRTSETKAKDDIKQESLKSMESILKKVIEDPNKLVPGAYPPVIEATLTREMKAIAISKTKQGLYRDSYFILKHIKYCERVSLGRDHPQVANTLYHIGVALNFMGNPDQALNALEEGIQILFPKRFSIRNMDLAALYYQYAMIVGRQGDCISALYHLDLAGQVEKHLLGHCSEKTTAMIAKYKNAKRASLRKNQSICATA